MNRTIIASLILGCCFVSAAQAVVVDNFDNPLTLGPAQAAGVWYTDRYAPNGFTGAVSFGGIAAAAGALGWLIHDLLRTATPHAAPEAWRLAMIVLIGLFAVWGVRLVVRMFLSHLHLATDAAERVVMTRTYLSLLEGDRLSSKDDRQLILQALFRPSSDGLVKDEGIPPSMLEFLTRQGKG